MMPYVVLDTLYKEKVEYFQDIVVYIFCVYTIDSSELSISSHT